MAVQISMKQLLEAGVHFGHQTQRWLGGMLTNFSTVTRSLGRFKGLKKSKEDGSMATLPRQEVIRKEKELVRLSKGLSGIETLGKLPTALFIIDTKKERNAVMEA